MEACDCSLSHNSSSGSLCAVLNSNNVNDDCSYMCKTSIQSHRLKSFMQKSLNVGAKANLVTQLMHVILISLEEKGKYLRADAEKV